MRIRVETKGDAGGAFSAGVYDTSTKKGLGQIQIAASNIVDGAYRDYDVATFPSTPSAYLWVAPRNNETNVPAIYIDRMDLVPAEK